MYSFRSCVNQLYTQENARLIWLSSFTLSHTDQQIYTEIHLLVRCYYSHF
jgi:hypothetical protein